MKKNIIFQPPLRTPPVAAESGDRRPICLSVCQPVRPSVRTMEFARQPGSLSLSLSPRKNQDATLGLLAACVRQSAPDGDAGISGPFSITQQQPSIMGQCLIHGVGQPSHLATWLRHSCGL